MTLGTRSLLVVCACAALFACKKDKKDAAATGSGSAGSETTPPPPPAVDAAAPAPAVDAAEPAPAVDAAEAAAPAGKATPELKAFEDAVAAILAIKDEDARVKAACKALDDITTKLRAVDRHPPAGVDQLEWTAIAESTGSGFNDFSIECSEGEASNTKALAAAAEGAKEFYTLIKK